MNPYNITQVDVPGLLSIYQKAQQGRAEQMKARREEDRAAERESVMSRLFAPKSAPSSGGATGAMEAFGQKGLVATPEQEAATARLGAEFAGRAPAYANDSSPMAPQAVVDPSRLPPRTDGVQLNPDALRDLYRIDPDTALKLQTSVYNANKQQLDQMQEYGAAGLGVVYRLKKLPQEQRAAELQASLPLLQSMGIDTSQLAQADLTDNGLTRYEAVFGNLADLKPKLRNVGPGDFIIDENRIGQPGDPTVYESPIVKGEDGVLYERNRPAPQQQTATNPQTGETVVWDPHAGRWKPMGVPPVSSAPGRVSGSDADAALKAARAEGDNWLREQGLGGGGANATGNFR